MTRSAYARWMREQQEVPDLMDLIPSQLSDLGFLSQNLDTSPMQSTVYGAYRASDTARRHRLRDSAPYDQTVSSYTRRKRLR